MKCLKFHSIYRNHNNGDRNEFYDIYETGEQKKL